MKISNVKRKNGVFNYLIVKGYLLFMGKRRKVMIEKEYVTRDSGESKMSKNADEIW